MTLIVAMDIRFSFCSGPNYFPDRRVRVFNLFIDPQGKRVAFMGPNPDLFKVR